MKCPDRTQEMLGGTSGRASEHRERARKLREIANVAQSHAEQARLNSRAEMFDAFAQLAEQPAKTKRQKSAAAELGKRTIKRG